MKPKTKKWQQTVIFFDGLQRVKVTLDAGVRQRGNSDYKGTSRGELLSSYESQSSFHYIEISCSGVHYGEIAH